MIRVAIADDHPIVREGLTAVLSDETDFVLVGSAASAEALVELCSRARPDVALVDLELPAMGGIDAIVRLQRGSPATRVIVFTAYDTPERVDAALGAGAKGYLLKGAPSSELVKAIRDVTAGGSALDPRVAARVLARLGQRRDRLSLSPRERDVLRMIGEGLSNKQIAKRLSITERTVKYHVASLLNKLGAENRAQAIAIAAQKGLVG